MDTTYRRRTVNNSRKAVHRVKRPAQKSGVEGDGRRLAQLLVSLILFLLVYIGRGVFPVQIEAWCRVMHSNVDFTAVFQEFGQAISDGAPVGETLEALCVQIFGGEPAQRPDEPASSIDPSQTIVLLSQTPGVGRAYLSTHGVMASRSKSTMDEPVSSTAEPTEAVPTQNAEPTQLPVVTAMAQEYTDDGVKLPSNVSFTYYNLGLVETIAPVNGTVTSGFGYRDSPINGKNEFHLALDIAAEEGTEIGAFADGVVKYIGESDEFGQYLKITHNNNTSSFYAHCSKLLVHKGDTVTCGQTVALVGQTGNATGPHLHLTIEKDDIRLDPAYYVDPS